MHKMSDIWSAITTWYLHRIKGAQQYSTVSYIFKWEVGGDCCTTVTVLKNVMSKVAHLQLVELYIINAIKKGVDFYWIRSASTAYTAPPVHNPGTRQR
jgi:hypothetical protein